MRSKIAITGTLSIMLIIVACGPTSPPPPTPLVATPTATIMLPTPTVSLTPSPTPSRAPKAAVLFLIDNSISIDGCTAQQKELRSQIPSFFASVLQAKYNLSHKKTDEPQVATAMLSNKANKLQVFPLLDGSSGNNFSGLDVLNGDNDYPASLDGGRQWLDNTHADNKILVLITDGWFYSSYRDNRDKTGAKLDELAGAKTKISVLLVRLNDCKIVPGYHYEEKGKKLDDQAEQKLDNNVWDTHTHDGIILATSSAEKVIQQFIKDPLFVDIIPQNGTWWTQNPSNLGILLENIPGDTWLLDVGIGSLNLSSVSYDEDGISKEMTSLGKGAFANRFNNYRPESGCPMHKSQEFTPAFSDSKEISLAYYWWQPTTYDKALYPISFGLDKAQIFNRESLRINTLSLNGQSQTFLDALRSCYKLDLYAKNNVGTKYVGKSYELNHLDDLLNTDLHHIFEEPFDDQYETLTFSAEIVKKTSGEGMGENNAEQTVNVRFKPELVYDKSNCNPNACKIILRYVTDKYYASHVDPDLEIWGLTRLDTDHMKAEKPNICAGWFPNESYQSVLPSGIFPIPFHIKNMPRPSDIRIKLDADQMQVSLESRALNASQDCEVQGLLFQRPIQDSMSDVWQNIYCHFDTGKCEPSPKYQVITK